MMLILMGSTRRDIAEQIQGFLDYQGRCRILKKENNVFTVILTYVPEPSTSYSYPTQNKAI
jgi:hypothetical protein